FFVEHITKAGYLCEGVINVDALAFESPKEATGEFRVSCVGGPPVVYEVTTFPDMVWVGPVTEAARERAR
ncbi:MAG: hypothetical protein MI723_10310, partial [Caulobacterales bacterium]|nr:hypothetical protein [Caulobacterales bacterium]